MFGGYLHADFYTVDLEQRVEVAVPVHITGKAIGVEEGGVLDQALREIELSCLPLAIPKELMADVSELELGQSLHVRDIPLPEGVELKSDPELSVVSVVAPMKEEEEPVVEEGAEEGEAAPRVRTKRRRQRPGMLPPKTRRATTDPQRRCDWSSDSVIRGPATRPPGTTSGSGWWSNLRPGTSHRAGRVPLRRAAGPGLAARPGDAVAVFEPLRPS